MLKETIKLFARSWTNLDYIEGVKTFATEATFNTTPFRLHRLDVGPANETTLSREDALKYFKEMTVIRKMEAKINALYKAKKVQGFCHLYTGQEAIAAGIFAATSPLDSVITSYRCHPWAYAYTKEDSLRKVIAELMGRQFGCSKGKGGSMHMYAPNFYGGNGIVGAQVPLGAGVALYYQYMKKEACCIALYGDGASNNGQVFEAFNMAQLWNLPCIFLCENNHYSMGMSIPRSSMNHEFYKKGDIIPGLWMNGMDFFSVKEGMKFARNLCISGKGPIVVEADTYRYFGHSLSDPGTTYRTREEIDQTRKTKDPITFFKNQILSAGLVTEDELKTIDNEVKKAIEDVAKKAETDKTPPPEDLTLDIYSNDVIKEIRLTTPFTSAIHKTSGKGLNLK